jgi:hypothetical protein
MPELKVLDTVVILDAVDVVNLLGRHQESA